MKKNLLTLLLASAAWAADEMPGAATILDRYVEVTGGKAAYEKRKAEISTGRMEMPAQGMKGTMMTYSAAPNLQYTIVDLAGVGKIESGTDGQTYWENSAMQGPRIKKGADAAQSRTMATFNLSLRWRDAYREAKTVGADTVDGQPCWEVELIPAEGPSTRMCYAKESGLALRVRATMKSPMGDMPMETFMADYRDAQGVKMPHRMTQKIAGVEMLTLIDKIECPEEIGAERFALPGAIRALMTAAQE